MYFHSPLAVHFKESTSITTMALFVYALVFVWLTADYVMFVNSGCLIVE